MNEKKQSLKSLRVLVTRPEHQAAALCHLIEQQAGCPIVFPTVAIDYKTVDLQTLPEYDIAIFTSPNAVWGVQKIINESTVAWPSRLQVVAIGTGTAHALNKVGIDVAFIPLQFNSEGLLALPFLQTVQQRNIILFRGEGGRELIGNALRERGAKVREAIVYQRVLPAVEIKDHLSDWQKKGLDIIVVTSNSSLQNLITLVGPSARDWLLQIPLVVMSKRIADFAHNIGFVKRPFVVDNADDEAIVRALLIYSSSSE